MGMANAYYNLGNYSKAIEMAERVIALNPSNAAAYNLIGSIQFEFGKHEEGLEYFVRAVSLGLKDESSNNLNTVLAKKIEEIEQRLKKTPNDPNLFFSAAFAYFHLGKYPLAREYFNKNLTYQTNNIKSLFFTGYCFLKESNPEKAIEYFKRVLDINPGHSEAHHLMGSAYFMMSDIDSSINSYRSSLTLDPDNKFCVNDFNVVCETTLNKLLLQLAEKPKDSDLLFQTGKIYYYMNDFNNAIEKLGQAINRQPNLLAAYKLLSDIYILRREYYPALDLFHKYLNIDPYEKSFYKLSADLYLELGKYKYAFEDYKRYLEFDKDNIEGLTGQAKCYLGLKNYHQAADSFEYILSIEPENIDALIGLGDIRYAQGDTNGAFSYYDRCYKAKPDNWRIILKLGQYHLNQKEYPVAYEYIKKVSDENPNNEDANYLLGIALYGIGESQEAIQVFLDYLNKFPYGKHTGKVNDLLKKMKQEHDLQIIVKYDYS